MDDILWWMYIVSAIVFLLTVAFSFWVAYDMTETGKAIDEVETQIMCLLDEALQILIPTPVLNYISQYDVANFEMTETGIEKKKIVEVVSYAEDVSRPISEKEQMYEDFGDSDRKKKPKTAKKMSADTPTEFLKPNSYRSNEMIVMGRSKSSEPSKGSVGSNSKKAIEGAKPSAEKQKTPKSSNKGKSPAGKTSKTKSNVSREVTRSNKTAKTKEKVDISKEKPKSSKGKESVKTASTGSSSKMSKSPNPNSSKDGDSNTTQKTKQLPSKTAVDEGKPKENRLS